jgi:hypothetical protein
MSTTLIEYIKCPNCGCPIEAFIHSENYVSVTYRGEEHGCKEVVFTVDKDTGETRPFGIERISIDKYMAHTRKRDEK